MFKKLLITNKNELLIHRESISELFKKCFDVPLDKELWNWAYVGNVCGDPVVSLYYHEEKLVGHYAIIPMRLKCDNDSILVGLSMTTMVDASYRRHGLFVKQANEVYESAKKLGFTLVYGFPNARSAPGFKKRLGWTMQENGCVVRVRREKLLSLEFNNDFQIYFDKNDKELLNWRLSKPGGNYILDSHFIVKKYHEDLDVVLHENLFSGIGGAEYYNVFIEDCSLFQSQDSHEEIIFEYFFGYKMLDDSLLKHEFKIDLIMSDVF